MADDGGLIARLEQWMVDILTAITSGGVDVFKTADKWRHQISASKGGMEAFSRYQPFAFVAYQSTDSAREGDHDLRQVLEFVVLIGVESKEDGVARYGDAINLGTSKIRDLVIKRFDKQRPTDAGITCDEFYFTGDVEVIDSPKRHAIEMTFEVSQLTSY